MQTHKPEPTLAKWKSMPSVRVLACGGDGTVAWILQALDKVAWHPPVRPTSEALVCVWVCVFERCM